VSVEARYFGNQNFATLKHINLAILRKLGWLSSMSGALTGAPTFKDMSIEM